MASGKGEESRLFLVRAVSKEDQSLNEPRVVARSEAITQYCDDDGTSQYFTHYLIKKLISKLAALTVQPKNTYYLIYPKSGLHREGKKTLKFAQIDPAKHTAYLFNEEADMLGRGEPEATVWS